MNDKSAWVWVEGTGGLRTLLALADGTMRFEALRRATGVNDETLTRRLRAFEGAGLVTREVRRAQPPHVRYTLTPDGQRAAQHAQALVDVLAAPNAS